MAEQPSGLRERTTASNVLSGAVWTVLANGLAPMLLLAQSIAAARFLGPTGMGRQSYIAWAELTVGFVLSAGATGTLSRYLGATIAAGRGGQMRSVLRMFVWLQLAAALVPVPLFLFAFAPSHGSIRSAWALAGVAAALLVAQAVANTVLVALQHWRQAAVISLVTGAIVTVATIVVLAAGGGITGMFAVDAAALVLSGVWSWLRAGRLIRDMMPAPEPPGELRREVLGYAAIVIAQMSLAYLVWQRSEFYFLDRYSTARQIAMYSIAFATVTGLQRLPEGLTQTLIPSMSVLVGADERSRLHAATTRAMQLLWTTAMPLAAGIVALGPVALRLVYGSDYRESGSVIAILATIVPLVLVARVGASVLHALGQVRTVLGCLAAGVAVDVVMCVVLIPSHGAVGAAIANVVAQAVASALEILAARRQTGAFQLSWAHLGAATAAGLAGGLAAGAVVSSLPDGPGLALGILAGSAAYAAAFLVLRPVADEDLLWLENVAGGRLGGRVGRLVRRLRRDVAGA